MYTVCRKINLVCAALTAILLVDCWLLPKIEKKEKIVARKAEYHHYRNKYSGKTTKKKSDVRLMITENYWYPIGNYQQFAYWTCDSIRLRITPVLRQVSTGFVEIEGREHALPNKGGIFGGPTFIPIVFGLCAFIGVWLKDDREQTINFGIVNVILFLILLHMMRII